MARGYTASGLRAAAVRLDTLIPSVDHECRLELGRAVMDLGGWLRSLGLEKYEPVFRDNEMFYPSLPSQTLKSLACRWDIVSVYSRPLHY